jgi:hypothetical protein
LKGSSHDVYKTHMHTSGIDPLPVYYKLCDKNYPPLLAQIEAAMSHSYRIVKGKNSAKLRPVVDDDGHVIGTVSFEIPGFKSFFETNYTLEELLKWNVAQELVSRYIREEDDLHPGNWGVGQDFELYGIDFDMSLYSLTSVPELKGCRTINNGIFAPTPDHCFPVTLRDLEQFPILEDQQPCHWPTKNPNNGNLFKKYRDIEVFKALSKHPKFIEQKWMAFLIELIVPKMWRFLVIGDHFCKDATSQATLHKISSYLDERLLKIEFTLIQIPAFRKFIIQGKDYLQIAKNHLREKNCDAAKEMLETFMSQSDDQYFRILKGCMVHDLKIVIDQMGSVLASQASKSIQNNLIHFAETFSHSIQPFQESYFEFKTSVEKLQKEYENSPWLIPDGIYEILHNYKEFNPPKVFSVHQSIFFAPIPQATPSYTKLIEPKKILAYSLFCWITHQESLDKCIELSKECLKTYCSGLMLRRHRKGEIQSLIALFEAKDKGRIELFKAFSSFFNTGEWKSTSANTTLLTLFIQNILDQKKNKGSFALMRCPDLEQVLDMVQSKKWNPESELKLISCELNVLASKIN